MRLKHNKPKKEKKAKKASSGKKSLFSSRKKGGAAPEVDNETDMFYDEAIDDGYDGEGFSDGSVHADSVSYVSSGPGVLDRVSGAVFSLSPSAARGIIAACGVALVAVTCVFSFLAVSGTVRKIPSDVNRGVRSAVSSGQASAPVQVNVPKQNDASANVNVYINGDKLTGKQSDDASSAASSSGKKKKKSKNSASSSSSQSPDFVYNVEYGDTLSGVSGTTGHSVDEIANKNEIRDVDRIYEGESLRIPAGN